MNIVGEESPITADLARSGLTASDIIVRDLDSPERAATNTPHSAQGYVIPYFNIRGQAVPFYRVRIFDNETKYKQPKETPNHLYFPLGVWDLMTKSKYILITEGEKKAAKAVKEGFPCIALSGVDSWRNRILLLPKDSDLSGDGTGKVTAKLPSGAETAEDVTSPLAAGLQDLIDFALQYDKDVIIVYDTDEYGIKSAVQRAAAAFGFELRFRGMPYHRIRQLKLPHHPGEKIGLDDFLHTYDKGELTKLINQCRTDRAAFPQHPSIVDYLNKRLQKAKMSRKEMQQISFAILSDLDSGGMRLYNNASVQPYYFDLKSHKLLKAEFPQNAELAMNNPFSQHLYKKYGLSAADQRLMIWLGAQYTGEQPIDEVTPYRIIARPNKDEDSVIFQLNDAAYVVVDGSTDNPDLPGLKLFDNGANKILFEAGHTEPLDIKLLLQEYAKQSKQPLKPWWADVLTQVRLKDKDKQRLLTTMLYYCAPWLNRWRGMQLPVEMILGEPGSGKSTLCELRLNILTGVPKLRNAPNDIKDWHASITNSGGLHITDNVQLADKNFRQKLSDELCRIVTEPNPTIEARRLYSNAELMQLPVSCCFGITAIKQPFLNADILQRSIITELDKAKDIINGELSYDSNWMSQQLNRYGGREAWVAHHLYTLHTFFKAVKQRWNPRYIAKHRLINLEQSLRIMATIFDVPDQWIPDYITQATDRAVSEADWAFEGLQQCVLWYRQMAPGTEFLTAQDISNWAMGQEDFEKCDVLVNSRKLGHYMKHHKSMIATVIGLYESGTANNRARYKIHPLKKVSN